MKKDKEQNDKETTKGGFDELFRSMKKNKESNTENPSDDDFLKNVEEI